jgi:hypothetical protein
VNAEKKDGIGAGGGKGHYQIAPGFVEATIDGTIVDGGVQGQHAFKVTAPNYKCEYFIPFSLLKDKDGNDVDITQPMGFDVTEIDGESAAPGIRQRAVWTNDGKGPGANESYNNMDDCGTITLSSFDGAIIAKATAAPELDGVVDAVWASATAYNIDKPFKTETPTLGEPGTTTWQALWNDDGIFLLLKVNDDEFYPAYMNNNDADWKYDKPEIYFDVNAEKKDGIGGGGGKGHYQFAPGFAEATIDGTIIDDGASGMHAFKVTAPTYVAEYFFPFSKLVDKDGVEVDKSIPMGFDVTIIDGESAAPGIRQRAVWSNDGNGPGANESYNNMDDCALVMFEGAVEAIQVEKITVSGGTAITTDGGTLQMSATIEPADASVQRVKWVVENGTGEATISKDGLLSAVKDGTVLVKAVAVDGSFVESKNVTVTISGQTITKDDIWNTFNKILNWNFDKGMAGSFPNSWGGWVDAGGMAAGFADPTIEDGVCVMKVGLATDGNNWHYQLNQGGLWLCDVNVPYTLKFKTWATADATPCVVDFESPAPAYTRYGASSDVEANGGRSEWHYMANIEPTWITFHVVFDTYIDGEAQKIQWMNSLSNETIYMDSVLLIKDADLALSAPALTNAKSKVQLYPNPVQNELTVSKIAVANSRVSVYNAVGQKLMEKTANGTQAKFDVANLRKGMYFVRFSDGTSEKFIKQ